jgi:hypothetical protein
MCLVNRVPVACAVAVMLMLQQEDVFDLTEKAAGNSFELGGSSFNA